MSFPSYSEYKDSGVEWLGKVPAHWEVKKLKHVVTCLDGQRIPLNGEERHSKKGPVPYWGANKIVDYVDEALFDEELVLLGEDGAPFFDTGRPVAFYSSGPVWPNNHIHVLRSANTEWIKLIVYALNVTNYIDFVEGSTRDKLTQSRMMSIPFAWPLSEERKFITAFLDYETAHINALIEEQKRLIELLKEKRQAVISHAVTKGLNPDVPMKDSGGEWLGEVPAHWSLPKKLDHIALDESNSFVNGPFGSDLLASELTEEGVPVIYIRDLKLKGYARKSEYFVTSEKAKQIAFCNVVPRDVLVAKVGDPPGLAVTYPDEEPHGVVTQDVIRIRTARDRADPRFLAYMINSDAGRYAIKQISVVSTRNRVSLGDFKQLRFCWPSADEQEKISDFLDCELASISRLIEEVHIGIRLLTERRSALISAAVTGKIDVRNWRAEQSTEQPEMLLVAEDRATYG
ncbi:restriction endonuclease subunit S [Kushneria sp. TE3]|uniref:restriction endonuclease subunit S n=1 Tax=Kushneria sp. TE3 TaxID=3449832 RepID=UPI003F688A13